MSLTEKISKSHKLNKKATQQFKNIEEQTWDVIYSYFKTFPKWMLYLGTGATFLAMVTTTMILTLLPTAEGLAKIR